MDTLILKGFNRYYQVALIISILAILLSACRSHVLYRIQVEDHYGPARARQVPSKQNYVIMRDSIAIFQTGVPMIWEIRHDSLRQVKESCENLTILNELYRTEYSNTLQPDLIYYQIVPSFVRDNPYRSDDEYLPIKKGANNDTIQSNLKKFLKGDFEYRAAYNIYSGIRKDDDSLGIFTSDEKFRKYRMINGIDSYRYSLSKRNNRYLFKFMTYYPITTENGEDTIGPLWLRGYLPQGLIRMTEASPYDFIFEYGKGEILWIHTNPNGISQGNIRPRDMTEQEARKFINSTFPKTRLYNGLKEIKDRLLRKDNGCEITLSTDRATIIAKGIDRKDYNLFSSMLRSSFIEKDQRLMMEIFLIALRDPSMFEKFLPEYYDFVGRVHLGMKLNDYRKVIKLYSDWPDRHKIKIDEE